MSQLPRTATARALALALLLPLTACASLTEPGDGAPPAAPPEPAAEAPEPAAEAAPTAPPAPEPTVGASHVLIQYKGSLRSAPTITRSKEEAKKLAAEVQAKAKKGQDFAALAKQYSDEPGAKERAGSLGKFTKPQMVKPFADAAFAMKPGDISDVVETDFGFHVIKRTE
ncbi:MAG: Peptidyl-prolyl cis-trans isomerase PpiD [Polyangiaceae bacterium]|nr:Peptidyl-prolyl cis-trans isomerase PpiD [Polyangiaceae bacterium]